jgi:CubicO group peptidase (beta-lactamase class C family)
MIQKQKGTIMLNFLPVCIYFILMSCGPNPEDIPNSQSSGLESTYPNLPQLDQLIVEEMASSRVPGLSACIVSGTQIDWCNGYGYANIAENVLVDPTTPFMIASISKTVVAAATMQLHENGTLDIDTPINSIIDFSVTHPQDTTPITTRMLLSHSAGIQDNWSVMNDLVVSGDSPIPLGEFLQDYLVVDGEYYNGQRNFVSAGVVSKSVYSNIGVALAAYVVEVASGIPFDDYCKENIFDPLQMTDTAWHLADLDQDIVAVPYQWQLQDWEPYDHYGYPDYPDGSLRTGAEQLAGFLLMHSNKGTYQQTTIVSQESVEEMNSVHYPDLDSQQGLVWYTWDHNDATLLGHNGGDYGVSTEMGIREDGTGFVILMNAEGDWSTLYNIEEALLSAATNLH